MYTFKGLYIIDFSNIEYYMEMHKVIQEALDFPDYYGCNWDAFWDCLTDMVGRPIRIEIIGLDVIQKKFQGEEKILLETLKEFKHYRNDKFANEIEIAYYIGNKKHAIDQVRATKLASAQMVVAVEISMALNK